jgi:hypothetical protein
MLLNFELGIDGQWEENSIVFRALQNFRNASLKIKAESSLVPESIPDSLPRASRIK